jgi:hypothetical protein
MINIWWSAADVIYNFLHLGETIAAEEYYHEINEILPNLRKHQPTLVNSKEQICLMIISDSRFNTGRSRK